VQPFSSRYTDFTSADAYEIAQRVRDIRVASGETAIGRKIGFTNRTVWDTYGLSAPIWRYMFDSTVQDLSSPNARFKQLFVRVATLFRFNPGVPLNGLIRNLPSPRTAHKS
jgi:2-keto-4-pentenoate hydratase